MSRIYKERGKRRKCPAGSTSYTSTVGGVLSGKPKTLAVAGCYLIRYELIATIKKRLVLRGGLPPYLANGVLRRAKCISKQNESSLRASYKRRVPGPIPKWFFLSRYTPCVSSKKEVRPTVRVMSSQNELIKSYSLCGRYANFLAKWFARLGRGKLPGPVTYYKSLFLRRVVRREPNKAGRLGSYGCQLAYRAVLGGIAGLRYTHTIRRLEHSLRSPLMTPVYLHTILLKSFNLRKNFYEKYKSILGVSHYGRT